MTRDLSLSTVRRFLETIRETKLAATVEFFPAYMRSKAIIATVRKFKTVPVETIFAALGGSMDREHFDRVLGHVYATNVVRLDGARLIWVGLA